MNDLEKKSLIELKKELEDAFKNYMRLKEELFKDFPLLDLMFNKENKEKKENKKK